MSKKILFLGYSKNQTRIIDYLKQIKNIRLSHTNKKIKPKDVNKFDTIISFGYRHILELETLSKHKNFINLHSSYLPFNRGAHPNFWAFAENTPCGVTIHKLDDGIDKGDIIFQKLMDFELIKNKKKLTFQISYDKLIKEIEAIFIKNSKKLINEDFQSFKQMGKGSYHYSAQLPDILKSWNQNIFKTVKQYDNQRNNIIQKKLEILNQIESTRKNNNVNWMNILRTSIKNSTSDTLKIIKMINQDDNKITKLFKKLNDD